MTEMTLTQLTEESVTCVVNAKIVPDLVAVDQRVAHEIAVAHNIYPFGRPAAALIDGTMLENKLPQQRSSLSQPRSPAKTRKSADSLERRNGPTGRRGDIQCRLRRYAESALSGWIGCAGGFCQPDAWRPSRPHFTIPIECGFLQRTFWKIFLGCILVREDRIPAQ